MNGIIRVFSLLWFKLRQKFLMGKAIRGSSIDSSSTVQAGTQMINSSLGRHSYIGCNCVINTAIIGDFCSIAGSVIIGAGEHPTDWVSTSPAFEAIKNSSPRKRFAHFEIPPMSVVTIGSDVWIGDGVFIKSGVTIGHGAVIGARSVVTKDVEPYAIVGGTPARLIRYRFDENVRTRLLNSYWWELSDDEITKIAPLIQSPLEFVDAIETKKEKSN